jgi:catechol 2,3-dioxygenase-like lactoylglutathione lyase family enzyme
MASPALNHVAVTVRDIEISGPWYRNLLGADPILDERTDAGFRHQVWMLDGGTVLVSISTIVGPRTRNSTSCG